LRASLVHLLLAVWALTVGCGSSVRADALRCEQATNVTVYSEDRSDALAACAGASDAIRFLGSLGLRTDGPLDLRIVDELTDSGDSSISGRYVASERCAYLLSFTKLRNRGRLFDLPIDRKLYQSLATHEVAHVIVAGNFAIPNPSLQAQEYISYVTMLGTMSSRHRELLFAQTPGDGFSSEMKINILIYMFDPSRFGVEAYRHFLKEENGKSFVQRILAGQALVTEERY
jgi:hypothetical protein